MPLSPRRGVRLTLFHCGCENTLFHPGLGQNDLLCKICNTSGMGDGMLHGDKETIVTLFTIIFYHHVIICAEVSIFIDDVII